MEGRFKREGPCVCLWLIHDVQQKPTRHCNDYPPIKKKKKAKYHGDRGMGRGAGADGAELMSLGGALGSSLPWVLLSWDVGELRVLTTPRVQRSYSAVYAKSSCQVWDKLTLILGLIEKKNFAPNPVLIPL